MYEIIFMMVVEDLFPGIERHVGGPKEDWMLLQCSSTE